MTGERLGSALLARAWARRTPSLRRGRGRVQAWAALVQLLLTLTGLEAGANDFSLVSHPSPVCIPDPGGWPLPNVLRDTPRPSIALSVPSSSQL